MKVDYPVLVLVSSRAYQTMVQEPNATLPKDDSLSDLSRFVLSFANVNKRISNRNRETFTFQLPILSLTQVSLLNPGRKKDQHNLHRCDMESSYDLPPEIASV